MADHESTPLAERFAALVTTTDDSDWREVERRAYAPRGHTRLWLAAAAAVLLAAAIAVATPALGLGGKLVQLFSSGEPAPTRIVRSFETMDVGAPPGMETRVIAGETRKAFEADVGFGLEAVVWVAPTRLGGYCTHVELRLNGEPKGGGAGCLSDRNSLSRLPEERRHFSIGKIIPGPITREGRLLRGPFILDGDVWNRAATHVELRFDDGEQDRVPVIWVTKPIDAGFFLYSVPSTHWADGHEPAVAILRDKDGRELARQDEHLGLPNFAALSR